MKKAFSKVLMIAAAVVLMTAGAHAQSGRFSVGAELGLPMGDFGDAAGIGIGGSIRYEHPLTDNIALYATAGYLTFSGKKPEGSDEKGPSQGMIPIQVGIKYYFNEVQEGFYVDAEVGVHMLSSQTYTFEYYDPFTMTTISQEFKSDSQTKMSYAPSIGYHLANIDISVRYQIIATEGSTTSYIGARVAYVFGEK